MVQPKQIKMKEEEKAICNILEANHVVADKDYEEIAEDILKAIKAINNCKQ